MYQHFVKRFLDIMLAFVATVILFPFLVFVALIITLATRESPLFLQRRPGYKGRPFTIVKFKTMTGAKDDSGELLQDEKRVTNIGKWMRMTSIDELPQLWNILRGDMSFIGPRPLLMHYLKLYTEEQHQRHLVRPGISGWAQINGRGSVSWERKFEMDVWYVKNISFKLDFEIFIKTIKLLVSNQQIRETSLEKMNRFKGDRASN